MKTLLVTAVLFFQAGSAVAGSCRSLEYAELKDSSSEKLVKTYCEYTRLVNRDEEMATVEQKYLLEVRRLGGAVAKAEKDLEKTYASLYECIDQRAKISSALENRKEPAEPSCAPQKPASSR